MARDRGDRRDLLGIGEFSEPIRRHHERQERLRLVITKAVIVLPFREQPPGRPVAPPTWDSP